MKQDVPDGYLQASRILEDVGFTQLHRLDERQVQNVRMRLSLLLTAEGAEDPLARSPFWNDLLSLTARCSSKSISRLCAHAEHVVCWLGPNYPMVGGLPPSASWAHRIKKGAEDLYVLPLPNMEWVYIHTHEPEFGPFLFPQEMLDKERAEFVPRVEILKILLDALQEGLAPGDNVIACAEYESYVVRAFDSGHDLTIGVDRVDQRIYAHAVARETATGNEQWRSEGNRCSFCFAEVSKVASHLPEFQPGGRFGQPLDPDDTVEISTRLELLRGVLPRLREHLRSKLP